MYISGFMAAVPTANKEAYTEYAKKAWPVFKKHGALEMMEGWGEDVPDGVVTSMPMAVQKKDDETVIFSWLIWPDKASATKAYEAMREEPLFDPARNPMPLDGKRMIWGNFLPILHVKA